MKTAEEWLYELRDARLAASPVGKIDFIARVQCDAREGMVDGNDVRALLAEAAFVAMAHRDHADLERIIKHLRAKHPNLFPK